MSFKGKKVIVTGAAGSVGKALVSRLVDEGALIYALDKDPDALASLSKEHDTAKPGVVSTKVVDLLDWDGTREIVEKLGPVNCLINNAGVVFPQSFLDTTPENIDISFGVHFKGAFNISQVVVNQMISAGIHGSIVNVSSVASFRASANLGIYCASKAAMDMLTKIMAVELGEHKIRVNSVNPTAILTEMAKRLPHNETFMIRTPLKRIARVDEVVTTILFILGDGCPMMNGAFVPIDGGYSVSAN